MKKNYIQINKTARYFTIGTLDENTQYIWFLIHGYAQTADDLLNKFNSLGSNHFLIAPEGLNKFYSRGFGGVPVASWMTSLERDLEIKDYCQYLEAVYHHFKLENSGAKIIGLGFSQGVSTLTRFIYHSAFKPDFLVMVAGEIAKEFQEELPEKIRKIKSLFLIGTEDSLIRKEKVEEMKTLLESSLHTHGLFEGKHEINEETIQLVLQFISEGNN